MTDGTGEVKAVVLTAEQAQEALKTAMRLAAESKAALKAAKAAAHAAVKVEAKHLKDSKGPQKCTGPGDCQNEVIALGLCPSHYRQQNRGKKLTPLRPYRELVKLPMVIRITPETMESLHRRVEHGAKSLYEATRQAVEAGVALWDAEDSKVKAAKKAEKEAKKAAKPAV